MLLWSCVRL